MVESEEQPKSSNSEVISASEVSQYVFCPEAWRLNQTARIGSSPEGIGSRSGPIDPDNWAQVVDELETLRFGLRVVFGLIIVACLLYEWG